MSLSKCNNCGESGMGCDQFGCWMNPMQAEARKYCCHDPRCPTSGPPYSKPDEAPESEPK